MKRTYLKGCEWCNATGFTATSPTYAGDTTSALTITCPVCNGNKTVTVTEED